MSSIFISYRRDDSADTCGRIYDHLVASFGRDTVFKDVDSIPLGVNFDEHISRVLQQCAVVLAVIGPRWLDIRDERGRRLDDPADLVRRELEAALQRGIPVIPALVQGARMPGGAELPPSLRALSLHNGLAVRRDPDFGHDMQRLVTAVQRWVSPAGPHGDVAAPDAVPQEQESVLREASATIKRRLGALPAGIRVTAAPLAQAIVREALARLRQGAALEPLIGGMQQGITVVAEDLRGAAATVENEQQIEQIAAGAVADAQIGRMIAEVMTAVGHEGGVSVEEGAGMRTEVEYVDGMALDQGYASRHFVTDQERMEAVVEDPHLLLAAQPISAVADILPVLEQVVQSGRPNIVVIADEVGGEALPTLIVNKQRNTLNALALKAPGFGQRRTEILRDIAIVTGGEVFGAGVGRPLAQATLHDLGRARRVVATAEQTLIVEGAGAADAIQARIQQLRAAIDATDSDFDRERLQQRLARIAGGVAVIRVGAGTDEELRRRKLHTQEALAAVRVALQSGSVAGCGAALLSASERLSQTRDGQPGGAGRALLCRALEEPQRVLAATAGRDGAVTVEAVRRAQVEARNHSIGFNPQSGKVEDLIAAGVIEPVDWLLAALQQAADAAAQALEEHHG